MKSKNTLKYLLLLLAVANYTASAQTWSAPVRILDPNIGTGGLIGEFSQMLVVNGNPAIAYYDNLRGDLIYVRATDASGTVWSTPITLDARGLSGYNISLQIVNGNRLSLILIILSIRLTTVP